MYLRVFSTAWANSYLLPRDLLVDDILADFNDGLYLINLIEALEQQKPTSRHPTPPASPSHAAGLLSPTGGSAVPFTFRSYHKRPKNTFQKTENIEQVLNLLRAQGSPLVGITAQSIADGQLKATLGLLWLLITKYDINEGGGAAGATGADRRKARERGVSSDANDSTPLATSAKDRMLRWVEETVATQAGQPVPVRSFAALSDGRVFAHLANKLQPDTVDVGTLTSDGRANLQLVFDAADKRLGIPAVLSAEELNENAEKVDSQSLITYLSFYRNWRPELLEHKAREGAAVEAKKQALLQAATNAADGGASSRRTPSLILSPGGKALDNAHQLELNEYKQRVTALEATITDLQREIHGRQRDEADKHTSESAETERLKAELADLQRARDEEAQQTKSQLAELEQAMSSALQTSNAHKAQQAEHESAVAALRDTLEASRQQATTLQNQLKEVQDSKSKDEAEKRQAIQSQLAEVQVELTRAQEQLKVNQAKQAEVEAKAAETEQRARSLEQQVSQQQQKGSNDQQLQSQLRELEAAMAAQLQTAQASKQRLDEQTRALEDLKSSAAASKEHAAAVEAQAKRSEEDKARITQQMKELQAELSKASQAQQEQKKKLEAITSSSTAQQQQSTTTAADVAILRKERDTLQEQLKAAQAKGAQAATSSVTAAQLEEKDKQIKALQAQLQTAAATSASFTSTNSSTSSSNASNSSLSASSRPISPAPSADNDAYLSQLHAKHSFDLTQLAKEKDGRIAQLTSTLRQLESAAKTARASEAAGEEEKSSWQRRLTEAEDEARREREAARKERARVEQLSDEKRADDDKRKREHDDMRAKLDEARTALSQQRREVAEAASLRKDRADQERRLGEERRKNRELLQRLEQVKRNRGVDQPAGQGSGSLSQRGSRRGSRAVSPVPPSAGRSFGGGGGGGGDEFASSIEDEKDVPSVSGTATTDDEEFKDGEAGGEGKRGKKKQKKRNGRAASASSHLINIQQSSSSRPLSPAAASSTRTLSGMADTNKPHSNNQRQLHNTSPTIAPPLRTMEHLTDLLSALPGCVVRSGSELVVGQAQRTERRVRGK